MPATEKITASKYVELSLYATVFIGWGVWITGAPTWVVVSTAVLTAVIARVIYILP